MAPRLPLDVVNLIIDDLAKHNDKLSSIKACALVCHSYLLLCRKHIFASVTLNARQSSSPTSDDLNNLLSNSPHLAVYILNLDYYLSRSKKEFIENRILWLLPMFKKLVNLQSLTISYCSYTLPRLKLDWMSSLERKVLLPLLHLPTLTSISLATIENFPIADLAGCVNLKSLETYGLECSPDGVGEFLETLPPTPVMLERLFVNWGSTEFVQKSCHARRPDGKPIIDFSSLKEIESVEVQLYLMTELFGMCENLHKITLTILSDDFELEEPTSCLKGLFTMLKPSLPTLVDINIKCYIDNDDDETKDGPLAGLCHELEKMVGRNVLKAIKLSFWIQEGYDCTRWGELDDVLMGSPEGWPALREVSLSFTLTSESKRDDCDYFEELRKLPMTKLVESERVKFKFNIESEVIHHDI